MSNDQCEVIGRVRRLVIGAHGRGRTRGAGRPRGGGGLRALPFAGPAVIASIAYMDPGNFATNIQAGAQYGYVLLWVVLLANLIAMLFQALSAKLGIVTGQSLAEMCRDAFSARRWSGRCGSSARSRRWRPTSPSSSAAPSALSLLFGLPLLAGMVVTASSTYAHPDAAGPRLPADRADDRRRSSASSRVCYLIEMFIAPVDWRVGRLHTVVPQLADAGGADAGGRHHRRDRDAARDLSAFRPDPGPHARAQRRRAPQVLRFSNREVVCRARHRRPGQHGDGDDGVERVPRRPRRGRGDRDRLSHADAAARHRRRRRVPDVAARLGRVELDGRHHGRPDDHAGLRRLPHSALGAPPGDHAAGLRRGGHRRRTRRRRSCSARSC